VTNKAGMVGGLLIRLSFEWIGWAGRWWILYRIGCVGGAKTKCRWRRWVFGRRQADGGGVRVRQVRVLT